MDLNQLLGQFRSEELAGALARLGESSVGSKAERIHRLMGLGKRPRELLDAFTREPLADACCSNKLPQGRKPEMIIGLLGLIEDEWLGFSRPSKLLVTKENVMTVLRQMKLLRRNTRGETAAEDEIYKALEARFDAVARQYAVGGYSGTKIDIDLGNGRVGVEVKLADSLFKGPTELYRLIGQAVFYQHRRYLRNLVVVIVGLAKDLSDPVIKESVAFLEHIGISVVTIQAM